MSSPYVEAVNFNKSEMTVEVSVTGHPTDALEQARIVIQNILGGHGAWCITSIYGAMPEIGQYPSDFQLDVKGMRLE